MKKFFFMMVTLLTMAVSSQAMSYEQAREQALFLADKMAYELNLTEDQYEACYEVNLDYLMSVRGEADLYSDYWTRRNLDLSYILLDWQYQAFINAAYFYRPLTWANGYWHFGIYAYYPHRHYYYYGRPVFWNVYRGGHAWHNNGGHSWYHGRQYGRVGGQIHKQDTHRGMRDGFNKGDYGRGHDYSGKGNGSHRGRIGQSSTRITEGNNGNRGHNRGEGINRQHNDGNSSHNHGTTTIRDDKMKFGNGNRRSSNVSESARFSGSHQRMSTSTTTSTRQSTATTMKSSGVSHSSGSSMGSSRGGGSSMGSTRGGGGSHSSGGSHAGGSRGGRR